MAEPRNATCDECGMQFTYACCREINCPGCSNWMDYGDECDCQDCRADDAASINVQRIATVVQLPVATVHAVIEMLAASTN